MFNVHNRNTSRTRCEVRSKLTIKTPEGSLDTCRSSAKKKMDRNFSIVSGLTIKTTLIFN